MACDVAMAAGVCVGVGMGVVGTGWIIEEDIVGFVIAVRGIVVMYR